MNRFFCAHALVNVAASRSTNRRSCLWIAAFATMFAAASGPARAASQEVVFRVGTQSSVDWFVIDNPSIHGTLNVANAPYNANVTLNGALVDLNRDRLVYDIPSSGEGYAINLTGIQLIPNAATSVSVTDLGAWPNASADAAYRKADGQTYYFVGGTDQLRTLSYGATGLITGSTLVGNLNGGNLPNSISGGDLDFSNNGSIWLTGNDDSSNPTLWNFDFTTLNAITTIPGGAYGGITFNAAGDTLYGFDTATGQYGIINMTTGAFQTVLLTDKTFFGGNGDLAAGTANISIVPEPASFSLVAIAAVALLNRRRRHA